MSGDNSSGQRRAPTATLLFPFLFFHVTMDEGRKGGGGERERVGHKGVFGWCLLTIHGQSNDNSQRLKAPLVGVFI